MKRKFLYIFGLLFVLFLAGCGEQESIRTSRIEVGKTYIAVYPVTLLKEKNFVGLFSRADFNAEQELKEYQQDNYPGTFYPYIIFEEGYYEKDGNDYHLITTREVKVTFKNVANIKKKIVSKIELDENPNPEKEYSTLNYVDGFYKVNNNQPVFDSDEKIPESIEDFLAQYEYVPEELE